MPLTKEDQNLILNAVVSQKGCPATFENNVLGAYKMGMLHTIDVIKDEVTIDPEARAKAATKAAQAAAPTKSEDDGESPPE